MKTFWLISAGMLCGTAVVLCLSVTLCAEPFAAETTPSKGSTAAASDSNVDDNLRVPVAVARDRAKVMHDLYATTLTVMHHRYFHGDRAVVPARAMEDIFSEIKQQSAVDARWISVNTKAMSVNHEPKSDFEKKAADEIIAGKTEYETVDGGYFRHAGAIRLGSGCISCHGGFFKEQGKTPKFAALVISVPVNNDSAKRE